MYDAEYFLSGLNHQVDEAGGDAIVTLVLHSRETLYVRDVVKTHPGYVMLNVWHSQDGRPIKEPSSEAYSQEYSEGYHPISVLFESTSMIDVMPTSADERRNIRFNTES